MTLLPLPTLPFDFSATGVYWQPNEAFINELAADLAGKKVLEVFAGNGLLTGYLAARGVDITATSLFSGMDTSEQGTRVYHPVTSMSATEAVEAYPDHDVLLMAWPTVHRDAHLAAQAFNKPIYFIGEKTDYALNLLGGTATDDFWASVEVEKKYDSYRTFNGMEGAFKLIPTKTFNKKFLDDMTAYYKR